MRYKQPCFKREGKTTLLSSSIPVPISINVLYCSKSSGAPIVRYHQTNNGKGNNNQIVQISKTAGHTKGDPGIFSDFTGENSLQFGLKATLRRGWLPKVFSFSSISILTNWHDHFYVWGRIKTPLTCGFHWVQWL